MKDNNWINNLYKEYMKIVKYDKYEVKSIENDLDYQEYVNLQSGRSGMPVNHNNFIIN